MVRLTPVVNRPASVREYVQQQMQAWAEAHARGDQRAVALCLGRVEGALAALRFSAVAAAKKLEVEAQQVVTGERDAFTWRPKKARP